MDSREIYKIEQDEISFKSCVKRKKRFVHISNLAISFLIEPPSPGKEDGKRENAFLNMYFSCTCSIDGTCTSVFL